METWNQGFLQSGRLPARFTRVEQGEEKGVVKLHGSSIYADYDLMFICRANEQGDYLQTSEAEARELFPPIARELNDKLSARMIQHGPEFLFKGVGAREREWVLCFGPGGRYDEAPSSFPKGGH